MNDAQYHLLFNHFPIIGTYLSVLILATGYILRNQSVKNTALALFVIVALFSIPALLTGEGAEDVLESIGQKNGKIIHHHEEMAEKAFYMLEVTGALALIALIGWRKKFSRILCLIVMLTGISNSVSMYKVGHSGGEIRHSEIREAGDSISVDDNH